MKNLTAASINVNNLSRRTSGTRDSSSTTSHERPVQFVIGHASGLNGTGGAAVKITGNTASTQNIGGCPDHRIQHLHFRRADDDHLAQRTGIHHHHSDEIINNQQLNVTSTSAAPAIDLANSAARLRSETDRQHHERDGAVRRPRGSTARERRNADDGERPGHRRRKLRVDRGFASVNVNGGPYGVKLANSTGSFCNCWERQLHHGRNDPEHHRTWVVDQTRSAIRASIGLISSTTTSASSRRVPVNWFSPICASTVRPVMPLTRSTTSILRWLTRPSAPTARSVAARSAQASTVAAYTWTSRRNVITDANGTAIQYLAGSGAGAALHANPATRSPVSEWFAGRWRDLERSSTPHQHHPSTRTART